MVLPAVRRPQVGAFFKGPPYPGYPFLMIPDLSGPYLPNGPLSPGGARTVSAVRRAPGRAGGRGSRDAPPGSATGWGCMRQEDRAELAYGAEPLRQSRVRLRWSAGTFPLYSPLWLGNSFRVHFWRSPWCSGSLLALAKNLDFVPVGRECMLSGAWRGGGLAFFLEIGPLSLAVGQWGREVGWRRCPATPASLGS